MIHKLKGRYILGVYEAGKKKKDATKFCCEKKKPKRLRYNYDICFDEQ